MMGNYAVLQIKSSGRAIKQPSRRLGHHWMVVSNKQSTFESAALHWSTLMWIVVFGLVRQAVLVVVPINQTGKPHHRPAKPSFS